MKCWICSRQARGYGYSDNRHAIGVAARYPIDWVFCSARCLGVFHAMYGNWVRVQDGRTDAAEVAMIDPSEIEVTCYTDAMLRHHEQTKYPPVRGMPATPDPMANPLPNPFADLKDDVPWHDETRVKR